VWRSGVSARGNRDKRNARPKINANNAERNALTPSGDWKGPLITRLTYQPNKNLIKSYYIIHKFL